MSSLFWTTEKVTKNPNISRCFLHCILSKEEKNLCSIYQSSVSFHTKKFLLKDFMSPHVRSFSTAEYYPVNSELFSAKTFDSILTRLYFNDSLKSPKFIVINYQDIHFKGNKWLWRNCWKAFWNSTVGSINQTLLIQFYSQRPHVVYRLI